MAKLIDVNGKAVFQHYAAGDILMALDAQLGLEALARSGEPIPPALVARILNERLLAAAEIEMLRARIQIIGRQ
jgi:hypothetical protein